MEKPSPHEESSEEFTPIPAGMYRVRRIESRSDRRPLIDGKPQTIGILHVRAIEKKGEPLVSDEGYRTNAIQCSVPDPRGRGYIIKTPKSTYRLEPWLAEPSSAEENARVDPVKQRGLLRRLLWTILGRGG